MAVPKQVGCLQRKGVRTHQTVRGGPSYSDGCQPVKENSMGYSTMLWQVFASECTLLITSSQTSSSLKPKPMYSSHDMPRGGQHADVRWWAGGLQEGESHHPCQQ